MQPLIQSCKHILENPTPSYEDMVFFLTALGGEPTQAATQILLRFLHIQTHIKHFIYEFSKIAFPKEYGFDPFQAEDILGYLLTPSQFDFSLKKAKGKHILYGQDHVKLRQNLVNQLPREIRCHLLNKKLSHFKLMSKITAFTKPRETLPTVLDILDIGSGHSVYLITLEIGDPQPKQLVIKQEDLPNQSLFCKLLDTLEWPSFESHHYEEGPHRWEISDYLGNMSLQTFLQSASTENRSYIEMQMAKHAALGDILGRGDRHFENYMVSTWGIVPIDISFLFWEGNEAWNKRYLAGGIYELSLLRNYSTEELPSKFTHFFHHYGETLHHLKKNKHMLEEQITTFFGSQNLDAQDKIQFIQERLNVVSRYLQDQKTAYIESFFEMKKRLIYKEVLIQLQHKVPQVIENNPTLKMFYLSDKDRPSCFFLLEEYPHLFHQIEQLACTHLEIQPGYFSSQCSRIESEKKALHIQF